MFIRKVLASKRILVFRTLMMSSVLILMTSCQDFNSSSFDKLRYSPISTSGTPEFQAAYKILANRCINCHSGRHGAWGDYKKEEDWLSSGLVLANDPDNSELIRRIYNSNSPEANMPPSGQIPSSEYLAIRTWIESI